MARYEFRLPDVGEGIAEAEIVAWHVAVGDVVKEDQPLADMMTDKATVELESPVGGRVAALAGAIGDRVPVGSVLVVLESDADAPPSDEQGFGAEEKPPVPATPDSERRASGRRSSADRRSKARSQADWRRHEQRQGDRRLAAKDAAPSPQEAQAAAVAGDTERRADDRHSAADRRNKARSEADWRRHEQREGDRRVVAKDAAPTPDADDGQAVRVAASPAVRKRAQDLGIDLDDVRSAAGDRIRHADLDAHLLRHGSGPASWLPTTSPPPADPGDTQIKIVGLRRRIAEAMQETKRRIPHFSYVEEIDMTALEAVRTRLNADREGQPRLTLLPFLIAALCRAVADFPQINATFDDDAGSLTRHAAVHMGVATQTEAGLLVPVIRGAQGRDIAQLASEIKRLADAARSGDLPREDLSGSTMTISSLGALGGIAATPVINRPEVAIVAVNKMTERPVVIDGEVEVRKIMNLSSSFDHRVVDGWDAARFIQRVKTLLESPQLLLSPG